MIMIEWFLSRTVIDKSRTQHGFLKRLSTHSFLFFFQYGIGAGQSIPAGWRSESWSRWARRAAQGWTTHQWSPQKQRRAAAAASHCRHWFEQLTSSKESFRSIVSNKIRRDSGFLCYQWQPVWQKQQEGGEDRGGCGRKWFSRSPAGCGDDSNGRRKSSGARDDKRKIQMQLLCHPVSISPTPLYSQFLWDFFVHYSILSFFFLIKIAKQKYSFWRVIVDIERRLRAILPDVTPPSHFYFWSHIII